MKQNRLLRFCAMLALVLALGASKGGPLMFTLTSPDFEDQKPMPAQCTCDGKGLSPTLHWSGAPEGTKSFALIVDDPDAPDPDAPKMTYVHWVAFNLPPEAKELPQGVKKLPPNTQNGLNDEHKTGYVGPCPPIGTHRYFFKLYALDKRLDLTGAPTKANLEKAMEGHVLAQATLMGTYRRGQ